MDITTSNLAFQIHVDYSEIIRRFDVWVSRGVGVAEDTLTVIE